ncbi:pentapeptide repeat-containing protein [Companilactobacillus paralimentarius]|uniref:pentapeptide repeat-containing protein n=1 Tax=Companilactobacillus paralimentarius TaxID=83526 RepID=UPI00384CB6BE
MPPNKYLYGLKDVSFNENKLKKTIFDNCELNKMNLLGTELKGIDFSSCRFESIDIDEFSAKGLKVNSDQANFFARYFLGLVIKY